MKNSLFAITLIALFSEKSFSVEVEYPHSQQTENRGIYQMLSRIYGNQPLQKDLPPPALEMTETSSWDNQTHSSWASSWDNPPSVNTAYNWHDPYETKIQRTETMPYVPASWDDNPITVDASAEDFAQPFEQESHQELILLPQNNSEKKLQVENDPPTLSDILKELDVLKERTNLILSENMRLQEMLKTNLEHSITNQEEASFFYNCIMSSISSVTEQSQQIIQHVKKTDYNVFRQGLKYIKTGAAIGTASFTAFETYATTSWFVSILPLAIAPPGWIPLGLSVTVGGLTYLVTIATF